MRIIPGRSKTFCILFLAVLLLPLKANSDPDAQSAMNLPLRDALNASISESQGLALEGIEAGQLEALKNQARQFVRYRKGLMAPKEKLFWMAECYSAPKLDVYCQ